MTRTADVVIVGGGVIGLASAFYVCRELYNGAADGKVVVIEKEPVIGAGATGKNAGGIRAQFSSEDNIIFSLRSIEAFERFKEDTGHSIVFNQCGYLFLQKTEMEVHTFEKQAALQKSLGVPVELLKPEEIKKLAPALRVDDVLRGNFSHRDGIADPGDIANGYYSAAKRMGAEFIFNEPVTAISRTGDIITGVKTSRSTVSTKCVINAAGPFAEKIAAMVDFVLPVRPVKRQIVTTGELSFINEEFPMVVDVGSGVYFHRETPGLLMGWADPDTPVSYDESTDPDYTDEILMRTLERVPQLEEAEIGRSWAGLYESTADHRAVIGFAPGVDGMIFVNGFSGHGLMHAPAAGMVAADLVARRSPRFKIDSFSPERFAKGALVKELNVI